VRAPRVQIQPPVYDRIRMTIPVREAFAAAGNRFWTDDAGEPETWAVELRRPPPRLVMVLTGGSRPNPDGSSALDQRHALRLENEPRWPNEWRPSLGGVAWWEHGYWTPCPVTGCGVALVWDEAGRVPGSRLCLAGHRSRLSNDGRSAILPRWRSR
jgi:hypothetical protein